MNFSFSSTDIIVDRICFGYKLPRSFLSSLFPNLFIFLSHYASSYFLSTFFPYSSLSNSFLHFSFFTHPSYRQGFLKFRVKCKASIQEWRSDDVNITSCSCLSHTLHAVMHGCGIMMECD